MLFRLSDCCSQILILDAQIFDIYPSVAMRVRDAYDHDQDCFKNVRIFQMLRKVRRSRAESQTSHSFAGGNDRRCNLIYMKPCHQAMMMWACGNPSMRCESRVRPGMTCMARTVNGDARSDVVRLHLHRSFVPHP